MARRHERNVFFIVDRRQMRGEVNRAATPSEMLRSFRFSEIVKEQEGEPTHSHSDELLTALAEAMTAENLSATFGMSLQLSVEDGRYAARRRAGR